MRSGFSAGRQAHDARPTALFPVAIWILIASFTQIRPLTQIVQQHRSAGTPAPGWVGPAIIAAFVLIPVLVYYLLKLRQAAIVGSVAICGTWTLSILVRMTLAVLYSPQVFDTAATTRFVYLFPTTAIAINVVVVWYLGRLRRRIDATTQ